MNGGMWRMNSDPYRAAVDRETQEDHQAREAELVEQVKQLTKRVRQVVVLSRLHQQGRDDCREDLHAARRALSAVHALLAGAESEGQHHVTIEAVRAAMSPERGTT